MSPLSLKMHWVHDASSRLLCIVCDDDQTFPFSEAACLLQQVAKIEGGWNSNGIVMEQGTLEPACLSPSRLRALVAVDRAFGEQWRCFAVATLRSGDFEGTRAIGLGSNKRRLQRSSAVALILTIMMKQPDLTSSTASLQHLWTVFRASSILTDDVAEVSQLSGTEAAMGSMQPLPSRSLERESQYAESQGSQLFALEDATSGPAPPEPPLPPCSGELAPLPPLPPSPQPASAFAVSERVYCADQRHAGQGTLEAFAHNEFVAGGCVTIAMSAPKSLTSAWLDGHDGKAVSNDFSEWDIIAKGLYRHSSADCHTIRSLDSVDTIPLGTDLDPANGYCNLWAASRVPAHLKDLVQCAWGWRVLHAEDLGSSFAARFSGVQSYDLEGVCRAVAYYLQRGTQVVIVAKRDADALREVFGCNVTVVLAEVTDDVMLLKHAYLKNCPVVSCDDFRAWESDPRLFPRLREWTRSTARGIQVHFRWSDDGEFEPYRDVLSSPVVLRPKDTRSAGVRR